MSSTVIHCREIKGNLRATNKPLWTVYDDWTHELWLIMNQKESYEWQQRRLIRWRILSEKYNLDVDSMLSLVTIGKINDLLCNAFQLIQFKLLMHETTLKSIQPRRCTSIGFCDLVNNWHLYILFFLRSLKAKWEKLPHIAASQEAGFPVGLADFWVNMLTSWCVTENIFPSIFRAHIFFITQNNLLHKQQLNWIDFISCHKYSSQRQMQMEWAVLTICFM